MRRANECVKNRLRRDKVQSIGKHKAGRYCGYGVGKHSLVVCRGVSKPLIGVQRAFYESAAARS